MAEPRELPPLPAHKRIDPLTRRMIAAELLRRYEAGKSIRDICAGTGYSIGRVRRLLTEAGVTFRSRGGPNRKAKTLHQQEER